jgi:hypothetical protein
MSNTWSNENNNSGGAACVLSPDGEGALFVRGDEMEPRFSAHERRTMVHQPSADKQDAESHA